MARLARVVMPGVPHHVTQRGNRRQRVFFSDRDYREYLGLLREWSGKAKLAILAYCLMPNHVHVVATPPDATALHSAFQETHRRYSRVVNLREGWRGYLWQGRFASFPMDNPHACAAIAYVENNPVRAGLSRVPEEWPWSSAAARMSGEPDALLSPYPFAPAANRPHVEADVFQRHTRTGRPLGSVEFIKTIEDATGQTLTPQKRGPKSGNAGA